jgi:sigma-B regulation protein RsbU (phosphoserine phosphatase)
MLPSARNPHSRWHSVRFAIAILFASAMLVYSITWMYYIRQGPRTSLGFLADESPDGQGLMITEVKPGSEAERAGVAVGDRLVSIEGRSVRIMEPAFTVLTQRPAGYRVSLELRKAATGQVIPLNLELQSAPGPYDFPSRISIGEYVAGQIVSSFPVLFVLVALPVLLLRLDDRNAWMMAICFAGMVASAPIVAHTGLMPGPLRAFVLGYMVLFFPITPAAFYWLFATFPDQSPLDRRVPWLKKVLLFGVAAFSVPLAGMAVYWGSLDPLWPMADFFGYRHLRNASAIYAFSAYLLALVSLVWNSVASRDREARRKTQVIVWGSVAALVPWLILQASAYIFHFGSYSITFWIWAPCVMMMLLLPLSFAYAILKHRVLDVPVLLRRSARYLLVQRGFVILMIVLGGGATLALADSFSRHYPERAGAAIPVGAMFGIGLVFAGAWVQQRVSRRVDKAFFRSSYDARQMLESLLAQVREVHTHDQLSTLLSEKIEQALHPSFLMIHFSEAGQLRLRHAEHCEVPSRFPEESPLLDSLFASGEPLEVTPRPEHADFATLGAECLVPIVGRNRQRLGLLALGPRLSEEPYSREDRRLLALVASSAASSLENIGLAEEIAQRMEREKRAAHEIELARQVQRKLFPQNPPHLQHLDFAGECVQARVVGGDYYDFMELAPGIVGFALADISGKGFPAALLMANLQANLRSQYALALKDMAGVLRSVNRLFCENSEPQHYATAFFCTFDDSTRRLRYVNCGHNPAIWLRADGRLQRLDATATVLGLFDEWDCTVNELQLNPGDLFVIYTDGVTEACVPDGDEFGEERLIELLRRNRQLSAADLLRSIVQAIEEFSPGEKADDLTAVVGRVC